MTYQGLGIFEPREAEAAPAADVADEEQGEEEAEEEEEEQQEAYDDDCGQEHYDGGQFEEQYDAEAWSQMAYAMPMQWAAAVCSPCSGAAMFWPAAAAAGAAKRLSAHAGSIGHHRGSLKQRFCATFPSVSRCRHGAACAFAHSREEVSAPLLSPDEETYVPDALTEEFFTERFKVYWCPIGGQHDWHSCMYAHTYQDVRRPPSIGYGHQLCPYWNKKDTGLPYSQRCPLGPRCPYAHGAKEQLYHPGYFRTLVCRDLQRRRCPRGQLCAFFHKPADERATGADSRVDYNSPLDKTCFPEGWYSYFMNPPRFQEVCDGDGPITAFPMSAAPKDEFVQTPRTRAHSDDESLDAPEAPKGKGKGKGAGGKGAGKGARRAAAMNAYAAMGGMPFGAAAAAYRSAMGACGGHELDMAWGSGMDYAGYNNDYPVYAGMGYLGGSWDASYPMYAPSRGF